MSIDAQRYGNSYIMDNYLIGYFNIVEEAPICFIFKDLDDASIASIKMRAYTYGHKFISDRIIRGCDFIFRIDCRYDPTLRDIPALIHTHMCHTIIHANSAKKNDILSWVTWMVGDNTVPQMTSFQFCETYTFKTSEMIILIHFRTEEKSGIHIEIVRLNNSATFESSNTLNVRRIMKDIHEFIKDDTRLSGS